MHLQNNDLSLYNDVEALKTDPSSAWRCQEGGPMPTCKRHIVEGLDQNPWEERERGPSVVLPRLAMR